MSLSVCRLTSWAAGQGQTVRVLVHTVCNDGKFNTYTLHSTVVNAISKYISGISTKLALVIIFLEGAVDSCSYSVLFW